MLSLRLLGIPQVILNGEPVDNFVTRKAQALLCYLAMTQTCHARDKIATMFWPNRSEQSAKNNLRRTLPNLRQLVGEHLIVTPQTVAFNCNRPYVLDVEMFSRSLSGPAIVEKLIAMPLACLAAKTALYTGRFLEGLYIADAPEFEEWLLLEREHLHQQAIRALTVLAERYLQTGDTDVGLAATKQLLELEPWHEPAYQLQMHLFEQNGQRTAALAKYELCRKMLADEFGIEPCAEMRAHYERLKAGNIAPAYPFLAGTALELGITKERSL